MTAPTEAERSEWLEADGLGGFASGTPSGIRTRRYHALLVAATTPPTGRFVLVNGFDAFVERPAGRFALSSQRYAPDVVHPDGASRLADFSHEPWPRWRFGLPDGSSVEQELFAVKGEPRVVLSWRLRDASDGAVLAVRPFVSGRDLHALQRENPAFDAAVERRGDRIRLRPYRGVPGVSLAANGRYAHAPLWYRGFAYAEERARGFEYLEDLLSPGELRFDLARGEALCVLEAIDVPGAEAFEGADEPLGGLVEGLRQRERARRAAFGAPPERAADAYVVRRGAGRSLVAGYPWFTDWGRDTFIALRGIALATGRLALARDALLAWSGYLSEGMLPNRFPDRGEAPDYNSVDASLWYCIVARELIEASERAGDPLAGPARASLEAALRAIVEGYARGTRYGIRADSDGLLLAGEPGTTQLTWMDARVGGRPVTPRVGKPVEVQALWVNALRAAGANEPRWLELARCAERSFAGRFFDEERGFLADVVDVDGRPGEVDAALRPNQILAVGGCPTRSCGASAPAASSTPSRGPSGRPSGCGPSRPRSPATTLATRAARWNATPPTTRARSGPGCSLPSSRPGCACAARVPRPCARRGRAFSRPSRPISPRRAWATSRRSPMPSLPTPREVARSRPGRSAPISSSSASWPHRAA